MTKKRWVLFFAGMFVASLLTVNQQSLGETCDGVNCNVCETPCVTYRDGSDTSRAKDAPTGGGGGGTSDTLALPDAPFGVTKVLRQCDFNPEYTITCPGNYVFGEPIQYQGIVESKSALIIASDDVNLNLNGYSLIYEFCDPYQDRVHDVNGIDICAGRRNVTVRNGDVRRFTGAGVKGFATVDGADTYGTGDGVFKGLEHITINEIHANNNKIGIHFKGYDPTTTISSLVNPVCNLRILYSTTCANDDAGIRLNGVTSSELVGNDASNNGVTTAQITAKKHNSRGAGDATAGINTTGIDLINSNKLTLRENTSSFNIVRDSTTASGESFGIYLHHSSAGAGVYSTLATPLAYRSTSNFYTIESIMDANRVEQNDNGIRDEMSPSSIVYTGNIAVNNGTTRNGMGNYGIQFSDSSNVDAHGKLFNFTNVASLAQLQNLYNSSGYGFIKGITNLSVGIAGVATDNTANAITPKP